jgi:AraC-like DNA-binding protein
MDIHTVDSDTLTVEDVVKAHMQDLAIQDKFGVTQIKYWVNEKSKTLFCLMEGPDKNACNMVHKESHGNTACNIIEVSDDEYNLFLGEGNSNNDLALTNSGELDTGYRTVLLLSIASFTDQNSDYYNEIYRLVEEHHGVVIIQPEDEIMVSFIYATDAILYALAIEKVLKPSSDEIQFTLALSSGRPVDEQGTDMFEETKKKIRYLCDLGLSKTMYLDFETIKLSDKERISSKIEADTFKIIQNEDSHFLFQLFDIFDHKLYDPNFKTEDINTLLGLSKSQTYRRIKSLSGYAPNQLIQELRLLKSLKKLKKSEYTISEVAFDLGFNSPTYFAKAFKKRFNITPTTFTKISPIH